MAFRIREKRKGGQKASKPGKDMSQRNDKEERQARTAGDAIAGSSGKTQRGESNLGIFTT